MRGIGFVWNSDNYDEGRSWIRHSFAPAAWAYDFFQGPIVPSIGDTAHVSGVPVPDFKNLKMAHFMYYNGGGCVILRPVDTPGEDYYNYMRGRWRDGKTRNRRWEWPGLV